jgi:hypothetical protein
MVHWAYDKQKGERKMEKYNVYVEGMDGKRRFLDNAIADNGGRGLFDLYADECDDEEQVVVVLCEEEEA